MLAALVLLACSRTKTDVVIDNSYNNLYDSVTPSPKKVVIDDTMVLNLAADSTVIVKLEEGFHTVNVGNRKDTINVNKQGGMVNLNNIEYILYPIIYEAQKSLGSSSMPAALMNNRPVRKAVLIDSFVVVMNEEGYEPTDKALLNAVTRQPKGVDSVFKSQMKEFRKFGKGSFYIQKDWNFNYTDSIPETVQERSSGYLQSATSTYTAAMPLHRFLLAAMLNREMFTVKSLEEVRKGAALEDQGKVKANKEKEKHQMDF